MVLMMKLLPMLVMLVLAGNVNAADNPAVEALQEYLEFAEYGEGAITSRIGLRSDAVAFSPDDDLFETVRAELDADNVHCVLVDESQFLKRDQVYQLTEVVDRLEIPVLCFGLRTDFQGELFEGSRYLLAWADILQELKTICHTGRKATMVVRVDDEGYALREGSQVEIGGNERYISVSRKEFKRVFYGGERVRLFVPPEPDEDGGGSSQLDLEDSSA